MTGFKTFATSIAVMAIGVLEQLDITTIIPDQYDGIAIAAVGLVMALLRLVTSTPPFAGK